MADRPFINYGRQWIDEDDIAAVTATLQSDFLTQGPRVREFEEEICRQTKARFCLALANGTAALHLAIAALDLPAGSQGITSPITFMATSNALIYNGLQPAFCDVEEETGLMDPEALRQAITAQTRVVLPVHYAGQACRMPEIQAVVAEKSREFGHQIFIIEDGAHAIGSCYDHGSLVGDGRFSQMTIFSFHPVKTITSGEGGALVTN